MAAVLGVAAGGAQGGAAEAVAGGGDVRAAGPLRGAARARRGGRRGCRGCRGGLHHTGMRTNTRLGAVALLPSIGHCSSTLVCTL